MPFVRSTVNAQQHFGKITRQVEEAARDALNIAAREARRVAQSNASINLELEVQPAHGDVDGYSSGIESTRRRTSTNGKSTPIAWFFSDGTFDGHRKRLKRPRKTTWKVTRAGATYMAHRGTITPGSGIPAERFFLKARAAGRRELVLRLSRLRRV